MTLYIYNTPTRSIEEFIPIKPPYVGMYTCGMTVYDFAHIGHGRKYVNDDILRRVLIHDGYEVKHVQNVTDVGHLVSDADEGDDKLEKGAKRTGKTVWEVAKFYTDHFYKSMDALNNLRPDIICKATDHIPEQIALVKKLIEKGYAYDTPEAVYFDISKFKNYDKLFGQKISEKKVAVRGEVEKGIHKKHPEDFALWFKRVGHFTNHTMHWDSTFGDGFPGWHLECSAMSMKYLGETFDIHTGGIDHLSIHHPNEIAQSEAATGKKFVNYWVHYNFLMVGGQKMSKSLGNYFTIDDVINKNYNPLALRYLYMQTHYRQEMNFTWEALDAASVAYRKLIKEVGKLQREKKGRQEIGCAEYERRFSDALNNDLNTSEALAVLWELIRSDYPALAKIASIKKFDEVLGLKLFENARAIDKNEEELKIPQGVQDLLKEREAFRKAGDFDSADEVRKKIEDSGFMIQDTDEGPILSRMK